MKQVLSILALAASALVASTAQGAIFTDRAVASGPSESPPNSSPGSAVATFSFDDSTYILNAEVPFQDLVGTATAAHIHCCTSSAFTGASGIALPFTDFPTGVTSGLYTHSFDLSDTSVYDPAFLAANGGTALGAGTALLTGIAANEAYLNIHTTEFAAGEIRGFLVAAPVPEPGSWAMLGAGLAGVGFLGRRRRKV